MWFETLTGFPERPVERVRTLLSVEGTTLHSSVNGRSYECGRLETPSLGELRERVRALGAPAARLTLREVVGDAKHLHTDRDNAGALFQVASQFNLLEMTGPTVKPEAGVDIYEGDPTQGPACAIAAGAGTIYRNYFAPVNGRIGQSADNQIDCLADLGATLGNEDGRLWRMQNGYAMFRAEGLEAIARRLRGSSEDELDELRRLLRIGIMWNTQVTQPGCRHLVSQAYCSALPVGYNHFEHAPWAEFAGLVLEASYEATLCAAILNAAHGGSHVLYLTLVGGGAFGNAQEWILDAIRRAVELYRSASLDVRIVSHWHSNEDVVLLARELRG